MFSTLFFHCPSPRPSIKVHIWGYTILTALQLFPKVVFALWRSVRHWQKTKTWREDEWEVYPLFIPSPPPHLLGEIKEKLALSLFYYLSPWLNHPPTHHTVLLPSSLAYHPLSTSCLSVCALHRKSLRDVVYVCNPLPEQANICASVRLIAGPYSPVLCPPNSYPLIVCLSIYISLFHTQMWLRFQGSDKGWFQI